MINCFFILFFLKVVCAWFIYSVWGGGVLVEGETRSKEEIEIWTQGEGKGGRKVTI